MNDRALASSNPAAGRRALAATLSRLSIAALHARVYSEVFVEHNTFPTRGCDDHHLDSSLHLAPELSHIRQQRRRVPPALRHGSPGELNGALVRAVEWPCLPQYRVEASSDGNVVFSA